MKGFLLLIALAVVQGSLVPRLVEEYRKNNQHKRVDSTCSWSDLVGHAESLVGSIRNLTRLVGHFCVGKTFSNLPLQRGDFGRSLSGSRSHLYRLHSSFRLFAR